MSDQERVWKLIEDIDFCMFTTNSAAGMRARPMSSIVDVEKQTLHFLTDTAASVDDNIEQNPDVLLSYSNGSNKFVSLTGRATLSSDRALIKSLWNPGAQAFWPEGPEAAKVVAIAIAPASAAFWDGHNGVVSAFKFAAALATGQTPDMGDSGKVTM